MNPIEYLIEFFKVRFRRKKINPFDNIEKAQEMGLITEEEMLRLKLNRAEENLKKFLFKKLKNGKK